MLQVLLGERLAQGLRRERIFRDRSNPLDKYNDDEMYEHYRFTRRGILHVLDRLAPQLDRQTSRSHAIDGRVQVFMALRFYASGTVHHNHGDHHGISKASASRSCRRVTNLLVQMKGEIIKFPTSPAEVAETQADFFAVSGMPRIVSAVDCTHVALKGSR